LNGVAPPEKFVLSFQTQHTFRRPQKSLNGWSDIRPNQLLQLLLGEAPIALGFTQYSNDTR